MAAIDWEYRIDAGLRNRGKKRRDGQTDFAPPSNVVESFFDDRHRLDQIYSGKPLKDVRIPF